MTRCTVIDSGISDCYDVSGPYEITVTVDPPAAGLVTVNTYTIPTYPWSGEYFGDLPTNLKAEAASGYVFSHWTLNNHVFNPDPNNPEGFITLTTTDTIVAHFNSIAPNTLTVNIDPTDGGGVTLNGQALFGSPWSGEVAGDSILNLVATPIPGYEFSYWESSNPALFADLTLSSVTFNIGEATTLTAHFTPIVYELTVQIDAADGGTVDVNGTTIFTNTTITLSYNELVELLATPLPGFVFDGWTIGNHALLPDNSSSPAQFNITADDTLTAHFSTVPSNTITIVFETEEGSLIVNGSPASGSPFVVTIIEGETVTVTVTPNGDYLFDFWELVNGSGTIDPNNPTITFSPTADDTLVVHFVIKPALTINVNPTEGGTVSLNGTNISTFPYSEYVQPERKPNGDGTTRHGLFVRPLDAEQPSADQPNGCANCVCHRLRRYLDRSLCATTANHHCD